MTKQVTVEELRENLREVLAEVKSGESVEITDAGTTIAAIRPTIIRSGVKFPFRDLTITPLEKPLGVDPLSALIEDRESDRR
jgi:prevent-host-death family protein